MKKQKKYNIKIFDQDNNLIKTVPENIRKNKINFSQRINGGQGELLMDLQLDFDDLPFWVDVFNFVRVFEIDENNPTGRLIYSGFISQYEAYLNASNQGVILRCLGLVSIFSLSLFKDGGLFDVDYVSEEPREIIRDIITDYSVKYSPSSGPEWIGEDAVAGIRSGGNMETVGTNVKFTFSELQWRQAINKIIELSGGDRYWFVDKGGDFNFKEKPSVSTHKFTIGKDVEQLIVSHDTEQILNDVTVLYSGGSVNSFDANSKTSFGTREFSINELNTDNAVTAQQIADQRIVDFKDEKIRATLVLNDEFDIETVNPGDTCKIRNLKKGSTILGDNLLIMKTRYTENKLSIELEAQRQEIGQEILKLVN